MFAEPAESAITPSHNCSHFDWSSGGEQMMPSRATAAQQTMAHTGPGKHRRLSILAKFGYYVLVSLPSQRPTSFRQHPHSTTKQRLLHCLPLSQLTLGICFLEQSLLHSLFHSRGVIDIAESKSRCRSKTEPSTRLLRLTKRSVSFKAPTVSFP